MRAWIGGLVAAVCLCSCRPTATVQRTSPVANLQPYRGLVVRGTGASRRGAGRLAFQLEHAAVSRIQARCAFSHVRTASDPPPAGNADLILDVTVQRSFRGGGGGLVQNENLATVDVKLVLSDGRDDELVGAADIRGQSRGIVIGEVTPEEEAIGAVADSIAQILVTSGCTGPRIARKNPPPSERPPPDDPASVELVSESDPVAKAEAANDEGKRLFRSADVAGAKKRFQAAIRLHRDPRYVFNLCLAEEALGDIDAAVSVCESVLTMKPDAPLAEKVKLRLDLLADKRKQ
jgi:hypothetical protein